MKIYLFFFFFYFGLSSLVSSQSDSCSSNLNLSNLSFNTASLNCNPVWDAQGFILRYVQSGSNLWNFVLSTPNTNSYVAIGFSTNGKMVGSSAMVGWIPTDGAGVIKQYYLRATSESGVLPDQGNLQLINTSSTVISQSSRIYLAFQIITDRPLSDIIYAVGPTNGLPSSNNILSKHRDKVSTYFDYATGQSTQKGTYSRLRKGHGIVNMVGWGILMPIGAIVARYLRQWDPIWFYSHVTLQTFGFSLGLSGIITGFVLYDKLDSDVKKHRALGISVLVLGGLQVMALFVRPDKASKVRKYWNWYHYTIGRALIGVAVGNIFYGIHVGDEDGSWNIGYGVALGVLVASAICLEVRRIFIRR